jgi:putative FmdB family regulatory protein
MPTYDYECDACGHKFEEFQSFSEAPLKKCPACKKSKLRRLIGTGAAVVFKGSGFYETDYKRGESYKAAAKADQEPSASSSGDKPATDKAATTGSNGTPAAGAPATGADSGGGTKSKEKTSRSKS